MFLLATKGRVSSVRRFLTAAREMGTSLPGLILVNRSEWERSELEYRREVEPLMLPNWKIHVVEAETYGESLRQAWPLVKDLPWVGLVSDDLVPGSSIWDKNLVEALAGWNVVSSNDGWQAPNRMHGATVWSGDLLRAVGYLFPDGFDHLFHDDLWETLGKETGCWQVRMDIMVKHLHESRDGIIGPTMDPRSALWKHDQAAFQNWLKTDKASVVEKIEALKTRYGVMMMQPNYTGLNIMIGVPSIDGKYESAFMISLFTTMAMLKEQGVTCQLAEEKYTADIAYGRANLFSAFLRSTATHFLMIDSDMGWDNNAVMRLICAVNKGVEFVAIAGPKKRYPLQFAASYTDERGNPKPLIFDYNTGTMEVSEIGMAFCMITRSCAEKMARAYPELEFSGVTGEAEYALFIPMVQGKRWYSEDFAFCMRWRNIGGTVHMVPDIPLTHVGSHTFAGAFLASAQKIASEAAD